MKVAVEKLVAAGKNLLACINGGAEIPYVNAGMSLTGMDCQGLVEYCLVQAGVPKSECNLAGSNAHWRAAAWRGTPEQLAAILGKVPAGAAPCIHANDGGEVARGYHDEYGNCSHIGLYLGDGLSIAASQSRGKVVQSNFKGKTIPNGGWNAVILFPWVDYGLTEQQLAKLGMSGSADTGSADVSTDSTTAVDAVEDADVSKFFTVKRGCKGGAVARLQTWLADLGFMVKVDHDFGAETEAMVKVFQRDNGLVVDGIVGQKTWAALASARTKAQSAS